MFSCVNYKNHYTKWNFVSDKFLSTVIFSPKVLLRKAGKIPSFAIIFNPAGFELATFAQKQCSYSAYFQRDLILILPKFNGNNLFMNPHQNRRSYIDLFNMVSLTDGGKKKNKLTERLALFLQMIIKLPEQQEKILFIEVSSNWLNKFFLRRKFFLHG